MEIKPALLETTLQDLRNKCERVSGMLPLVQIDMCDGSYVPSITYGYAGDSISIEYIFATLVEFKLEVEYDLMINFKDNSIYLDQWITHIQRTKPKRIIIHYGSVMQPQLERIFDEVDERSTKICLGVGLQDEISHIEDALTRYSFWGVQVMGIEKIGYSGEPFSEKTYVLLERLHDQFPEKILMVDGGVSLKNASRLKESGATSLAANSALYKADSIEDAAEYFQNI